MRLADRNQRWPSRYFALSACYNRASYREDGCGDQKWGRLVGSANVHEVWRLSGRQIRNRAIAESASCSAVLGDGIGGFVNRLRCTADQFRGLRRGMLFSLCQALIGRWYSSFLGCGALKLRMRIHDLGRRNSMAKLFVLCRDLVTLR